MSKNWRRHERGLLLKRTINQINSAMSFSKYVPSLSNFVRQRPLLLNSITYGFFYTTAEFLQQAYNMSFSKQANVPSKLTTKIIDDHRAKEFAPIRRFCVVLGLSDEVTSAHGLKYDWAQLKRYAIYGCFLAGPMLHGWYKWLDAYYSGTSMRIVAPKLFADQFILTPVLLVVFFVSTNLMEGKPDISAECKAKFIKTFQTSCIYWLPVQFLNFTIVPPNLRVLFVSVAAFCWVNILCYFKRTPLPGDRENEVSVK